MSGLWLNDIESIEDLILWLNDIESIEDLINSSSKPNYEINEYGYKFMGQLPSGNVIVIFDSEKLIVMTNEEYLNFSRERKLKFILNK